MPDLDTYREALHVAILDKEDGEAQAIISGDWIASRLLISNWWDAYKDWESKDTFNVAVQDDRMAMRSYASDFKTQVVKKIDVGITKDRFLTDTRQSLPDDAHLGPYKAMNLAKHQRGIEDSAYADENNFATRQMKYSLGLHDLSMRLYKKGEDIKGTSHHKGQANPNFSFLALSKSEDQFVIYKLLKYAKALRGTFPQLYLLTHEYKSKMTRVKLSSDYDMGTGYTATPTPGRGDGLAYKAKYGLGNTLKVRGGPISPGKTTLENLQERRMQYFHHRADIVRYADNEIVVAVRQHAGPFPVYAFYDGTKLQCYDITMNTAKPKFGVPKSKTPDVQSVNGRTISANGVASW